MPRVHDLEESFNSGELHPRLAARLGFAKYRAGLETCENLIPLSEGGVMRRAGTRFVAEIKSSSVKGRLKRFQFSTTQAYMLEFGDRIMRFYRNQAQISVATTSAVITNGTFDSSVTGWTDVSTGGAGNQISHDATNMAFIDATNDSLRTYRFDGTNWAQVGSSLAVATVGDPALAALNATDIAFIDDSNDSLRTYRFDGTNWSQVGSSLAISTVGFPAIAALNATDIAFIDNTNDQLRTYRFDGKNWAQVGNSLAIATVNVPALAAMNSTDVAFIDSSNDSLRTYRFDGTNWAQVGNSLAIATVSNPALAAMSSTDVAFIDNTNNQLRTYRFDGTNWTQVGNGLVVAAAGFLALTAMNSTDVAFIDASNDQLRTYRFDGTDWAQVGNSLAIATVGFPALAVSSVTRASRLVLETNGTASDDIGWAEQAVTTANTGVEHVIKFRVIGAPSDKIEFQVGTASTGSQTLAAVEREVGWHCVAFTPTSSPFYVQFRNRGSFRDKDVKIDDVSIISNAPVEIDTPWPEADLYQVEGTQSADVLYLFRDGYPAYKLLRFGHSTWSLVEVAWEDGPYLDENITTTTLLPSAASGLGINLTLSSVVGVNDGQGWLSTDIGRLVRYKETTVWGYAVIVSITSSTVAVADVRKDFEATPTAVTTWRLGAWSGTTGYPQVGGFYQQRLYVAATDDQPQTLWASQTADFENFKPDNDQDGVEADDALDFTLSADGVDAIRWLSAGQDALVVGTTGGEWVPKSDGAAITPLDIQVRRQTPYGSAQIQPVRIGNIVLFVQRANRKLREFGFSADSNGYLAPDMTRLAWHVTRGNIVEMDYSQEPDSLTWAVRGDGQLLSMTYRREEDVVGWARHILGGSFSSGDAVVESVAVIPGANGSGQVQDSTNRDEVWLIVKRTINGSTKRYVEFLERDFETGDAQEDAYYSDSLITYDGASATTITGLSHLEGQTVKIWADGAIQASKTVNGGQITLNTAASVVQIGLGYTHKLKTLKISAGNPAGTPLGKLKRIYGLTFALLNSHTLDFGPDEDNLTEKDFRVVSDAMDEGAPLFTGEQFVEFHGDWTRDARVVIQSDDPAPFTLLSIAPEIVVNPLK